MNASRLLKAAAVLMLLAGCAADNRSKSLEDTLELYGRAVRWGNMSAAVQFIDPQKREDGTHLRFQLQRFEQVNVTGYQPLSRTPGFEAGSVQQVVEINLVNRHTAVGRTIRDVQDWRWDDEHKRWWLTSGLPDLGRH